MSFLDILVCLQVATELYICVSVYPAFGVDELALLTLYETYSLPVLMHAVLALRLKPKQMDKMNVCWNNVGLIHQLITITEVQ